MSKKSRLKAIERYVKDYFTYNPETGGIYNQRGARIKTKCSDGYIQLCVTLGDLRTTVRGHRVAWFLYYGVWPKEAIDHIDGCKTNNKLSNMREASRSLNSQNQKMHRNGRPVGVSYLRNDNKWLARAPRRFLDHVADRPTYIGIYRTMEEAGKAVIDYCTKEKK